MQDKKKIIIVDDHPLIRKGLLYVLTSENVCCVIGEAASGEEALKLVDELNPDIVLLDINLPGMNGLETAAEIKKKNKKIDIIFLTMLNDEDVFNSALDLGASAFIQKDTAANEIKKAIEVVSTGNFYLSQSLSHFFINRKKAQTDFAQKNIRINSLTTKEREIIKLIAQGNTTNDIAENLNLSPNTIENHRSNICKKLSLSGSNSLLKFAIENKSNL